MLPEEAKSSYQTADGGYDMYLRDATSEVILPPFLIRTSLSSCLTFVTLDCDLHFTKV